MNCMRCGKDTEGSNVFCAECLAEMEKYPVKPGTVIRIPARQLRESRKVHRKKEKSIEEQLAVMHRVVRTMTACILGLVGALFLTVFMLVSVMIQPQDAPDMPMARNYSTSTPAEGD